jgi:transposase-like protein
MSNYKYIYGQGRSALNIPESDIRYAMENTKSNAAAARFLKISFTSYKKYAKMYTDRDTGKTLYELHKNQFGVGIPKDVVKANSGMYSIDNILTGKHPNYPIWKLRNRLLALAIFSEECSSCGYSERRITDDTVPLLLDHINGDKTDHRVENLQMLCLNCYYQQTGNPFKEDKEQYWNYNLLD